MFLGMRSAREHKGCQNDAKGRRKEPLQVDALATLGRFVISTHEQINSHVEESFLVLPTVKLTRGSTPAMIENAMASGISASATTRPSGSRCGGTST